MSILINTISFVAAFCAMEVVAWASHKYIMHGFGWKIHKDHHVPHEGVFERNDLFFLLFAFPSFLAIFYGTSNGLNWLTSLGFGISSYGLCYFLVHEVFIHQRLPWFKRTDNAYFRAIRKAHKIHHKSQRKEDGECFGMLYVPYKYFQEARQVKK